MTVIVVEWLVDPLVPVSVTAYVPAEVPVGTVTEMVAVCEAPAETASEDGLKLTVQPVGADAVKVTVPLKSLTDVAVTVDVPEEPACTLKVDGEETKKSGVGVGGGGGGTGLLRLPRSSV